MSVFVLALLLLAAGAAAYVYAARRRREDAEYRLRAGDREAELRALGISDVRPRAVAAPVAAPLPGRSELAPEPALAPPRPPAPAPPVFDEADLDDAFENDLGPALPRSSAAEPADASADTDEEADDDEEPMESAALGAPDADGVSAARPVEGRRPRSASPPAPYVRPDSPLWRGDATAATRLLDALWSDLGVQSVALVRHDDASGLLAVDAFLSRSEGRRAAPFPAEGNALLRVPADGHVYVIESAAVPSLRYHLDPDEAVGEAAALVVPGEGPTLLLVADAAPGERPFTAEQEAVLSDYAGRLADLFAAPPERVEAEGSRSGTEAPAAEAPPRKRVEIVADEMAAAREAGRPLALALVAPHGAEAVSDEGPEAVAEAERDLRERLEGVEGTARVERFGELLLGAFCAADAAEAEAWAAAVEASGPPVHIGVAVLAARHAEADGFRADAAAALHEAYARDEACVIVE